MGRKRWAKIFEYSRAYLYSGDVNGAGVVMTFRDTSPHAPTVDEPMFIIEDMTVLRSPLRMPCIWKHCLVVMRRSPWPCSALRSSRRRYNSGGSSPAGCLSRSMNW